MSGSIYANYMPIAFAGMKVDSMDDNVESWPCGSVPVDFGIVVGLQSSPATPLMPGGVIAGVRGISLHDHLTASRVTYTQYDAISVLTRGRAWVRVSAATGIADGVGVKYDPVTGFVNTTGTALTNAVFRGSAINLTNVYVPNTTPTTVLCAIVEMHYPLV